MALLYPDILQHNNSTKALVDITEIRGNSYPINLLSDTGSIPADKRKVGAIVFVSSSQNFYGFYGQTTASWDTATNWRSLGGIDTGSFVSTSSFNSWTGSSTSQFGGTSSYAKNAGTSSHILGGVATHIPFFITDTTLATSSLYQSGSSTVIINQDNATSANPEALYVWQPHPTSFNVISGKGDINNYLQLNIQNTNNGTFASSDVVATANNGDETSNYIDMGINGEGFIGDIGNENDAYLYSTGKHLHIGNVSNYPVQFFAGGLNSDTNKKLELRPDNNHSITGSLNIGNSLVVNQGITGSLLGNASTADSAINSTSASHAIIADSALAANYATTAGNGGVTSIIAGSGVTLIPATGTGNVTVITTGGGGTTIISGSNITSSFVNSNTWVFNHGLGIRTPTITVFDSNYNQIIPENIELVSTSSATITFPTLESGFAVAMVGGVAGNALSASYSLYSTYAATASYFEETDPVFVAKSGSFATTGSNRFIGNQIITGSLIVSSSNSVTVLGPMRITGSLLVSGSTTQIGNNTLTGNTSLTGSITVSGSQTYLGNLGLTGSLSVTGSTTQIGSNTLTGNTVLSGSISVSGSQTFKGSFDLTGSMVVSGSTAQFGNTTLVGNTTITGSMSLGGDILIFGDILPQVSSSYSLGSISQPWKAIYVQSGSINIQSDIPGGANAELINLGGDVSIQSAGFRVVSGSYTPFRVDPTGRTRLIVPNIPANDIGAFSIIGNTSGSYQGVTNAGGLLHLTSNDGQSSRITSDAFGTAANAAYVGRKARGTAASPLPVQSGDILTRLSSIGWTGPEYGFTMSSSLITAPTSIDVVALENYTTSSFGSRFNFYNVPSASTVRTLSAQIDTTGITIPSSSRLFGTASWALNTVSASYAQTASYVTSSNIVGTVLSSSYALTASHALNVQIVNTGSFATTGSNTFRGNQTISGSITTSGSLTVNGPAIFNDQTVQITGSLLITGSGYINGLPILTSANTSSFTDGFGWYGAFCSTGSQTNPVANISRSMQVDTVEHSNGVSLVSGSRITFTHAGVYNIQFSAQLQSTSAGDNLINIWFKKNGSNVARSNTLVNVAKQAGDKLVAAWNYIDTANANEYYEIAWQSADTGMQLHTDAATGNIPVTPSVIITATQVG